VARKATKDTYATENVGGVEVRRHVFAGDVVPEQYDIEDGAVEEFESKSEKRIGSEQSDTSAAYGDSPDPQQQEQAEKEQSTEQQQEPQSPAQPDSEQSESSESSSSSSKRSSRGR